MDIYNYLKKDHRKVSALFNKISKTSNANKRKDLFQELRLELLVHAQTEEKTFYAAMKKSSKGKKDVRHGDKEHDEITKALAKISRLPHTGIKWLIALGELKRMVDHHVDDEEKKFFKDAKKVLSRKRAIELAEEMDALKPADLQQL